MDDWEYESIKPHFVPSFRFIENHVNKGTSCLIHCWGGVSRSSSIVIAYLMQKNKWNLKTSYEFVKNRRAIEPNEGFAKQLIEFETELGMESSMHLNDFEFYDSD